MTQPLRRAFLLPVFGFILLPAVNAQQSTQKFVQEITYLLSLPEGYSSDTTARWPLMIFLHGSGEAGADIEKVKAHGPPKLIAKGKRFPMIVVSPQSDVSWGWDIEMLYKMLQDIKRLYRVNADKVYLTGLSMGGFGTISLAMKYPDEFAAIAPVCGGGDSSNAWKLRNVATWVFHGAKDDVVPPGGSANIIAAARRYNKEVRFTLYPDANHNSWDLTYDNDSLYTWLLSKTRFRYTETPVTIAALEKLQGAYLGENKDTVRIVVEGMQLIAKPPNETVPLKHFGNNAFFIDAGKGLELRFVSDKVKGNGFLFLGNEKVFYHKIK